MKKLFCLLFSGWLSIGLSATPDFHQDVAPVLREYCVGCHASDDPDGGLSVETFRTLMKGGEGGPAIVPGKPKESLLFQVLTGGKPKMPPRREPQPPSGAVAVLRDWIASGANGPRNDVSIVTELIVPRIAGAKDAPKPITAAEYSRDGKWFAVARYRSVELRESGSQKLVHRWDGHPGKVNAVHFSPDGRHLVTASGITGHSGVATIWELKSGRKVRSFGKGHHDVLFDAEWSPDGRILVTAGYDRFIRTWDAETGAFIRGVEGHNGAVFDLAFSPDGEILASASADETVKLWRRSDGLRLDTLNQPEGEQFAVIFSRNGGQVIAGGADKQIRIWEVVSRKSPEINPLVLARFAHEGDVTALAISGDGERLISASADMSLKTWRLPGLDPGDIIKGQRDLVTALAVHPDGGSLWVGRIDGSSGFEPLRRRRDSKTVVPASSMGVVSADGAELATVFEAEPNNTPSQASLVVVPATIKGAIMGAGGDVDLFRFRARAGEELVLEVDAARRKSPLDSHLEVLDGQGRPIERVRLQAVRDTWLTFRGKDSATAQDFRLFKWREMTLNQFLYVNGEVVKLWHYPRGPDSGYIVYPGEGSRWGYFDTTPMAHPLGQTAYIVEPLSRGSDPLPNGLPVFTLHYENDDESSRSMGDDSKLRFTAPSDGEFIARVRDIRGFEGKDYRYALTLRPRKPDFKVTVGAIGGGVPKGSGREFVVQVDRLDDYEGPVTVEIHDVPVGFHVTSPIVIEAGQNRAFGAIYAETNALAPKADLAKVIASAVIRGGLVTHSVNDLKGIKPVAEPKLSATILPAGGDLPADVSFEKPLELTIAPGQTISARLQIVRRDFKDRVGAGKHDAGRNLPHGVYVDNIGLNGLLIVEGQSEREFFITADDWVPEGSRLFHIKLDPEKGLCTAPVLLHVRRGDVVAAR